MHRIFWTEKPLTPGYSCRRCQTTAYTDPNWKETLDGIEYDPIVVEITKVSITGVVGQELGGQGWKTIQSAPDETGLGGPVAHISDEMARDAVKEALLDMAELMTVEAGYAATFKDSVYSAILHHVRAKF